MDYHKEKDYNIITDKLPILGVIFLLVIIVGFVTIKQPKIKYTMSIEEAWQDAVNDKSALRPERVFEILNSADTAYYRFIDLRSPNEFLNSHIPGAINIPMHRILNDDVKSILLQDKKINVFYSNHHREACAPVLLLRQIGYANNAMMLGGFAYYKANILDKYQPNAANYLDEKAAYDFQKIMSSAKSASPKSETTEAVKTEAPTKKAAKKSGGGGGGC